MRRTVATVERLMCWEEAARDAYERASRKAAVPADAVSLFEIREDHNYAAMALRTLLAQMHARGDDPDGASARRVAMAAEAVAQVFGRAATLAMLGQAELALMHRMEAAARDPHITDEARELIGVDLVPRAYRRVVQLERCVAH